MPTAWMVRAGRAGYAFDDFESKSVVAIGWDPLADLARVKSKEALRDLIETTFPDHKPGQRQNIAAQIGNFIFDIKIGEHIASYNTESREYLLGEVIGDYEYKPDLVTDHPHVRRIKWTGRVGRDGLSTEARNALGAIQTIFRISQPVWNELTGTLKGEKTKEPVAEESGDLDRIREDVLARGHEFIKDRIQKLAWDDMQDLVAGILRAMGYKTIVSGPGADRGKDIIASPDGLGLEQPRIRVEVKHRTREQMGAPAIRSFIGGLRASDRGLYVSTGGFTREAHYEAERSNLPVTLLDLDALVALLIQNYDNVDAETRALAPLIRVYWPAS